jgi:Domain of unknown function (DUF4282)
MPDRSSRHGLPDPRNHGSHARRQHSGDSDGSGAANTEAIPGTYGHSPATDPFAILPGGYSTGTADPFASANTVGAESPFGALNTDPLGAERPSRARNTDPLSAEHLYGVRSTDPLGAERPFGGRNTDALGAERPFGGRNTDPFGAAASGPYGTATFAAVPFGAETPGTGVPGTGAPGAGAAEGGTARPGAASATAAGDPVPAEATDARSFLRALFDFGFTSFVTPKVIKALYVLIAIGTVVSALLFTIFAFKASTAFGLVTLVIGDPLFIIIVLAIYRIALEFFMVIFRVGEDIRALRERGDVR